MANAYQNITGNTAKQVHGISKHINLNCLKLCNIHASDSVTIDLYSYYTTVNQSNDPRHGQSNPDNTLDIIDNTYTTYYLLKNVLIPKGVTLKLDQDDICHDTVYHDLYIKLSASDSAVDIIIKE